MFEQHRENLQLGFEMFEQDQQAVLSAYVSNQSNIEEDQLKDTLRLWPNYQTDYAPLIEFAKTNQLNCVASNIQRKYASLQFSRKFMHGNWYENAKITNY